MREMSSSGFNNTISTGSSNYYTTTTSAVPCDRNKVIFVDTFKEMKKIEDAGQYSVYEIADWFLNKETMTHKKLQKLCYYAQAWCYALKDKRLIRSDFQAWTHGPVSPALYEKFKNFGYDSIRISGKYRCYIDEEDVELLESVWETYGAQTGNSLEALSHRELPWIEARRGYAGNEKCTVVVSPETMKRYYKSIYAGE